MGGFRHLNQRETSLNVAVAYKELVVGTVPKMESMYKGQAIVDVSDACVYIAYCRPELLRNRNRNALTNVLFNGSSLLFAEQKQPENTHTGATVFKIIPT